MSEFIGEPLYGIVKAEKRSDVSIQTVKNWIYARKMKTLRTVGGRA